MADILISMLSLIVVLVLMAIALGNTIEKEDDGVKDRLLREIKRKSPKLYDVLVTDRRKLNEFEEKYILNDVLQYENSDMKSAILEFKREFLDPHTENPCNIGAGVGTIWTASEIHSRLQSELRKIKLAVTRP